MNKVRKFAWAISMSLTAYCLLACILPRKPDADERDYGRECIALTIFTEARSEPYTAQIEVGRVILRRLIDERHRWGSSICEVVQQPSQFEGVYNWKTPRHPELVDQTAWIQSQVAADDVIAHGIGEGPCSGALYFRQHHSDSALCTIGALSFYKE